MRDIYVQNKRDKETQEPLGVLTLSLEAPHICFVRLCTFNVVVKKPEWNSKHKKEDDQSKS
jgi:hypothetical protein